MQTSDCTWAATGSLRPIPHISFIERSRSEAGRKKFGISGHLESDLPHPVKDTSEMTNKRTSYIQVFFNRLTFLQLLQVRLYQLFFYKLLSFLPSSRESSEKVGRLVLAEGEESDEVGCPGLLPPGNI